MMSRKKNNCFRIDLFYFIYRHLKTTLKMQTGCFFKLWDIFASRRSILRNTLPRSWIQPEAIGKGPDSRPRIRFCLTHLFIFSFKKPAKIILCKRKNFEIMKIYRVKNPFKFLVHTQEQGQLLQFLKLIALIVWIHTPFLFHPCRSFFVTWHVTCLHSLKWTKT